MNPYRLYVLDAFTERAYAGNPCAVVFDADDLSCGQMQWMAREMNLSETAFVLSSNRAAFRVRYFTPRTEIRFAGHPTIATTYAMATQGGVSVHPPQIAIEIECAIGVLPVVIESSNGDIGRIVMAQPSPTYAQTAAADEAAEALRLTRTDLLPSSPPQVVGVGVPFLMIGIENREILLSVRPDWDRLRRMCKGAEASAAYLYAPGGRHPDADLCARFLDPFARYEDPFTGSACGAMAALAARNGLVDKEHVVVEQGEGVGRIGYADVSLRDIEKKLLVGGTAALVVSGTITAPSVEDGDRSGDGGIT